MRILIIIILITMLSSFLFSCGRTPTGETDYNQLRQEIQSGENPPPDVPEEGERERKEGTGELGM